MGTTLIRSAALARLPFVSGFGSFAFEVCSLRNVSILLT